MDGIAGAMLASHRELFEVPRGVAYFNNGSYTPLPRSVRETGEAGVAAKSTPWLMDPAETEQRVLALREAAAGLIGAVAEDIAIVPSAAYGVATAAANLPIARGGRILLIAGEFPSQSLEWARRAEACGGMLDVVAEPADGDWTAALLARIGAPGLPPVGVAALTPLVWTDGAMIDLERVVPALRAEGAAIVVDATQAVGVLPVDVGRLGADFLVFPTYKWLLGPYTLAFLYAAPHRQGGMPLERHGANHLGGAAPFAGTLPPLVAGARRFDMGQHRNPVSLPMALAGIELVRSWGGGAIRERVRATTDAVAEVAAAHGFRPVERRFRAPHIVGLRPPAGVDAGAVEAALARHHVYVAARGDRVRIGAHVFNDADDVGRFGAALAAVMGR